MEKKIIKMKVAGKTSRMHILGVAKSWQGLTTTDTRKYNNRMSDKKVKIKFGNFMKNWKNAKVTFNTNKTEVRKIFTKMKNHKFTHFKEWNEKLVICDIVLEDVAK